MTVTTIDIPADSLFGIDNLPYGIFSPAGGSPRVGVRVADSVVDLAATLGDSVFAEPTLNAFMALGRDQWVSVRNRITDLVTGEIDSDAVFPVDSVTMHLPIAVADYVDFYASENHATNLGRLFRPDAAPLMPNWKHLPVGYHGRSSTIVVSGTDIVRPCGQRKSPDQENPDFGPSRRLDIEAEMGFIVGTPSKMGDSITPDDFAEHVFGAVVVNDWSARDIQAWEYVPLGPNLGKSFATSISAWVVPLLALEAARIDTPVQDPEPLLPARRGEVGVGHRPGRRLERSRRLPAALRPDVLVAGADARAHHYQRRSSEHRRSLCIRNHFRTGQGSARRLHRTDLGWQGTRDRGLRDSNLSRRRRHHRHLSHRSRRRGITNRLRGCSRSDPAGNANRKITIDNCLIHADLMSGIPCLTILRR